MRNPNHPIRGSTIAVEPIRDLANVESIKKLLAVKPRDFLLFTIGVNCALRLSDILGLKLGDVRCLRTGDTVSIRNGRTGRASVLTINKAIFKALKSWLAVNDGQDDHYLFKSKKGDNMPLSPGAVNALIKSWTRAINLPGNYGAHTLRKTFGYIQRTRYGVGLDILASHFNHSSPSVTLRYLDLKGKDVDRPVLRDI